MLILKSVQTMVAGSFNTTDLAKSNNFKYCYYSWINCRTKSGDAESNVFKLQIRTGSTSGPVVIECSDITVTDAVSSGTNVESSFYEISNRYVNPPSNADSLLVIMTLVRFR